MNRKITVSSLLFIGMVTCRENVAPKSDAPTFTHAELYEIDSENLTAYYSEKNLRPTRVKISSGENENKLYDKRVDTGWQVKYLEVRKPWLELTIKKRPDQISRIYILPRCDDKQGKYETFANIKKMTVQYFGLLKSNRKQSKLPEDDDPHVPTIDDKNQLDVGGSTWPDTREPYGSTLAPPRAIERKDWYGQWYHGSIDDPDAGDENIYATKIRVTILEVEKAASDMICLGEVIVTAIR
jgi:hypothetical protein